MLLACNYTVISGTMPTFTTPVRQQRHCSPPPRPPAICRTCKQAFSSRNALFHHLSETFHYLRSTIKSAFRPIVASKAPRRKVGTGTAFKDFNYCEIRYQLSPKSPDSESWGCADTGSGMSLVDESVLESGAPSSSKRTVKSPVHVKGIGDEMYLSKESMVLDVFLPDVTNTRLAKIRREFHIVKGMECGLLIGNDIIEPEGIVIDLAKRRMQISACDNMACKLRVRGKTRTHVAIRCAKQTVLKCGKTPEKRWTDTLVPIRFPKLERGSHWLERSPLPNRCYLENSRVVRWDTKEFTLSNFGDEDVILPKDYKIGYLELSVIPRAPVKPVDVVQCHFRKAAKPQEQQRSSTVTNEVATASIGATPSRQVPKKTSSPCKSAPKMSPKSARCPPSPLRSSTPPPLVPSFSPVRSFLPPPRRSSFFFYRPPLFFFFSFLPPSTTYQGNNDPLGFYLYLPCRRQPPSFPPKPGLQLPPLVKLFTCATRC